MGAILITTIIIAMLFVLFYSIPREDKVHSLDYPEKFMVRFENRIDFQRKNECAAYSSAYVLRHLGKEADGEELYRRFPRKLLDGTVYPKGIVVFFKKRGYDASFYHGTIHTLKKRISQGIPVIVFIRVYPDRRYLHFAPVVGYDGEYLYVAESLPHMVNNHKSASTFNRKIRTSDFETIWKTWLPFCDNTYIVIRSQDGKRELL